MAEIVEALRRAEACTRQNAAMLRDSGITVWLGRSREQISTDQGREFYDSFHALLDAFKDTPKPDNKEGTPSPIKAATFQLVTPKTPGLRQRIETHHPPLPFPGQKEMRLSPEERADEFSRLPESCQLLYHAMHGEAAMEQVRELVRLSQQPSHAPLDTPTFSKDMPDWLARVVNCCRRLDCISAPGFVAKLRVRYWQVYLRRELDSRRPDGLQRNLPHNLEEVAKNCGWTKGRFKKQVGKGRLLDDICGGHIGLLVLLPIPGLCDKSFNTTRNIFGLKSNEKTAFRLYQEQSRENKLLCAFGSEALAIILHQRALSERMKRAMNGERESILPLWANDEAECGC